MVKELQLVDLNGDIQMFKLELDANYSDARKLGECFVGSEVEFPETGEGVLEGIHDTRFLVVEYEIDYEMYLPLKITLDLSTSNPNIWKLMEHGFKIEVKYLNYTTNYNLDSLGAQSRLLRTFSTFGEIKSIKILDLEKMQGVREVQNENNT